MEIKLCGVCKKHLPIKDFESHKNCRKCYKKEYYKRNKQHILKRMKNNRDAESLKKKQEGTYRWGSTQKDEKEKFQHFLKKHGVEIDFDEK